jgi:hypothetical protein
MTALRELAEVRELVGIIADWKLPETGETWPSGGAVGYETMVGSSGVRDYMRNIATKALSILDADGDGGAAEDAVPRAWISHRRIVGIPDKDFYGKLPIQSMQPGVYSHTPLFDKPPPRPPIIVPPYVSADDANRLYGERFGIDWKYEAITADTFRKLHPPAQAAQVDAWKLPPCSECGAKTALEAETMCICAGDKDDCHGTSIWPDDAPTAEPVAQGEAVGVEARTDAVWTCKIGSLGDVPLPRGADGPMRDAVSDAYRKLTGRDRQFLFSGWGGSLTRVERAIAADEPLPDFTVGSDGDTLQRPGDDAAKWASEFHQTALRIGYSDMDEGWLIGWFANAIEHSCDVRRWRKDAAQPRAVADGLKELADEVEACWICASNGEGEITLETINNWSGRLAMLATAPSPGESA